MSCGSYWLLLRVRVWGLVAEHRGELCGGCRVFDALGQALFGA
jgi:hypothetical protein